MIVRLTLLPCNAPTMTAIMLSTSLVNCDEGDDTALRSNGLMISSAMCGMISNNFKQNNSFYINGTCACAC